MCVMQSKLWNRLEYNTTDTASMICDQLIALLIQYDHVRPSILAAACSENNFIAAALLPTWNGVSPGSCERLCLWSSSVLQLLPHLLEVEL